MKMLKSRKTKNKKETNVKDTTLNKPEEKDIDVKTANVENIDENKDSKPVEVKPQVRTRKTNKKKEVWRVVVATPTYFVIKKNGETITVHEKNNYMRGQDILY